MSIERRLFLLGGGAAAIAGNVRAANIVPHKQLTSNKLSAAIPVFFQHADSRIMRGAGAVVPYSHAKLDGSGNYLSSPFPGFATYVPRPRRQKAKGTGLDFIRLGYDLGPMLVGNEKRIGSLSEDLFKDISLLLEDGLKVVLNCGTPEIVPDWTVYDIINSGPRGAQFRRYQAVLANLATRLHNRFDPLDVAIGVLNEAPYDKQLSWGKTWYPLCRGAWAAVRAAAPKHTIIVSGQGYARMEFLVSDFSPSHFDANTTYDVHFYEPMTFCFQNLIPAYGMGSTFGHMPPIAFPPLANPGGKAAAIARMEALVNSDNALSSAQKQTRVIALKRNLDLYFDTPQDEQWLTSHIALLSSWASTHNMSPRSVLIGEFGVSGDHPTIHAIRGATIGMRAAGMTSVRERIEAAGFNWCVHEWGQEYSTFNVFNYEDPYTLMPEFRRPLGLTG